MTGNCRTKTVCPFQESLNKKAEENPRQKQVEKRQALSIKRRVETEREQYAPLQRNL
jgi:hypothetical protein